MISCRARAWSSSCSRRVDITCAMTAAATTTETTSVKQRRIRFVIDMEPSILAFSGIPIRVVCPARQMLIARRFGLSHAEIRFSYCRVLLDLYCGSRENDVARLQDIRSVRDLEALGEALFDDEHGDAGLSDGQHGLEDFVDELRHDPLRWLIQHEKSWACHQCSSDCEHLLLVTGQRVGALRQTFLEARKQIKDSHQRLVAIRSVAEEVTTEAQIVGNAEARKQTAIFWNVGKTTGCDEMAGKSIDSLPLEGDSA